MFNLEKIYNIKLFDLIKNSYIKAVTSGGIEIKKESELYKNLLQQLKIYSSKITGYPARYLSKILKSDYISFVIMTEKPVNNYCYLAVNEVTGSFELKVIIVVKDDTVIKFLQNKENPDDIEKTEVEELIFKQFQLNIRDIVYSIYQELVRYKLIENFNRIKHDKYLHKLMSLVFSGFIVKIFGKKYAPTITEEQIRLMNLIICYMIQVYYLKFKPKDAINIVYDIYKDEPAYKETINQFKEFIKTIPITKYTDIKQLGTLLDDFGIIKVPGTKFIMTIMNEVGAKTMIDLFASYPSLICNFIIAKYPVDYISKKLLLGELNNKLEDYIVKTYM